MLQGGVWIYGEREYKYITQQFGLLQTHPCYFEPPHLHNNDRWPLRRSWTRTRTPGEGDPCGGPCAGDWVGYRGWVGDGGGVSKPKVRIVWIITLSCQDKDKNMEVMSGVWWLSAHINYPSVPFLKYFFFVKSGTWNVCFSFLSSSQRLSSSKGNYEWKWKYFAFWRFGP